MSTTSSRSRKKQFSVRVLVFKLAFNIDPEIKDKQFPPCWSAHPLKRWTCPQRNEISVLCHRSTRRV